MAWKRALGLTGLLATAAAPVVAQTHYPKTLDTRHDSLTYIRAASERVGLTRYRVIEGDSVKVRYFGFANTEHELYAETNPENTIISCENKRGELSVSSAFTFGREFELVRAVRTDNGQGNWFTPYITAARSGNESILVRLNGKSYNAGATELKDVRAHSMSTLVLAPHQAPVLTGVADGTEFLIEHQRAGDCIRLNVQLAKKLTDSIYRY